MSLTHTIKQWFTPTAQGTQAGYTTGFQTQRVQAQLDMGLLYVWAFLLLVGIIMVYSASVGLPEGAQFRGKASTHFLLRQVLFVTVGLIAALFAFQIPLARWNAIAPYLFLFSFALLIVVLIPFIGKLSNNARRWIPIGPFTIQPSELMKFAVIIFAASYCMKKKDILHSFFHGMLPMLLVVVMLGTVLLAEPDLGAIIVMAIVALGILFLGGSSITPLILMSVGLCIAAAFVILTSNRARRVLAFMDPWSPQFAKTEGFQLTNSLIAFGRGEIHGVGLGNSMEKLTHLSEAHTDFILAIVGEEFGFIGVAVVVGCFAWLVYRAFAIGRRAHVQGQIFESLVAQGIGLWLGLQAGIHLCVNVGALPTKGLTLPFISYGGSALVMSMVAMAVLLRIDFEARLKSRGQAA